MAKGKWRCDHGCDACARLLTAINRLNSLTGVTCKRITAGYCYLPKRPCLQVVNRFRTLTAPRLKQVTTCNSIDPYPRLLHPSSVPHPSYHAYSFAANLPSLDVEGCKQGVLPRACCPSPTCTGRRASCQRRRRRARRTADEKTHMK